MNITFRDNSIEVKNIIKREGTAWLYEACGEVEAQTKRNSKVVTGRTKGSYEHKVDENNLVGYIGSNYENSLWEEFGTGEYALSGNGRKGGWFYKDERGKWHFTKGKKAKRPFYRAYNALKEKIKLSAQERFRRLK